MKYLRTINLILCFVIISCFTSCKTPTDHSGKTTIQNAELKIKDAELNIARNNENRLVQIGEYSFATDYALNKIKSFPSFQNLDEAFKSTIYAAEETNGLVQGLSPSPSAEKMKEMEKLIENLTSSLEKEKHEGTAALKRYTESVSELNKKANELEIQRDVAIENHRIVARELGDKVDTLSGELAKQKIENSNLKTDLEKFDDGFGLYAIWHGIKVFLKKIMWIGIGFTVIFLVLKIFAASNPIAGSIFSVFESVVGMVFKGIASIFPKAWKFAGVVSKIDFDLVKNTRNKMVDGLEELYRIEQQTPGKKFTLDEVFDTFSKDMGDVEKEEIKRTLKELGWK